MKTAWSVHALALGLGLVAARGAATFESITLTNGQPAVTVHLLYERSIPGPQPVVLMLGQLQPDQPPPWATNLVHEGWMLGAFSAAYPPDPNPERRPQWLVFDERFAHSYPLAAQRTIQDANRVMRFLRARPDVNPSKIGWFGSSSTGIPGLAVATQGPRLAAVVTFVSTGAYRAWLDSWQPNGLWKGVPYTRWKETELLLDQVDPLLHAPNLWPTATLMVNGGEDRVVDADSARLFFRAAQPAFTADPDRLRLVFYEGFGHNLPQDVVRQYAEHWFRLYLHPVNLPPGPPEVVRSLEESIRRTQINSQEHLRVIGASQP